VAQTKINENDKPFLIECEAEGEPVPTYVFDFFSCLLHVWNKYCIFSNRFLHCLLLLLDSAFKCYQGNSYYVNITCDT